MGLPSRVTRLRRGDRTKIESLIRRRTTPRRVVSRARIVLASADGRSGKEICELVGGSRPKVTRWLDRYEEAGFEGLLEDQPRSGRPKEVSPELQAMIVRKTLDEAPPDEGTHWTGHAHHGQFDGRQSEHHVAHLAKPRAPASSDRLLQTLDRLAIRGEAARRRGALSRSSRAGRGLFFR